MSSPILLQTPPQLAATWQQSWLDEYPCDMPSSVPYPRAPLSELLERAARRFPDYPACTLYGRATTFAELSEQARRLARALADKGAKPGRHVGVLLPNIPEYLVALQAIWLTGATALQLSPLMVAEEVGHWLEATGCHIVVTLDLLAPAVTGALQRGPLEHVILTSLARRMAMWRGMLYRIERLRRNGYLRMPHDARRHRFADLLESPPLDKPASVSPEEDVAVLAPTGGTTSSPKAVMLTHRNLVANALQLRNWCGGEDGTESLLGVLPFFHAYGLTVSLLTSWAKCSTLHLYPRFETRAVLDLIRDAAARDRAGGAGHARRAQQSHARQGGRSVVHPLRHLRSLGAGAERARRVCETRRWRHRRRLWPDRGQSGDARQSIGRGAIVPAPSANRCRTPRPV